MNSHRWTFGGFVTVLLAAIAIWAITNGNAEAQRGDPGPNPGTVLRYQISAYAGQAPNGNVHHGCYIVDTTTGKVWHTLAGGQTQEVSGGLR